MIAILTKFILGTLFLAACAWGYFTFFFNPELSVKIGRASELRIEMFQGWHIESSHIGGSHDRTVTAVNKTTDEIIAVRDGKLFVKEKDRDDWLYYGEIMMGYEFSLNSDGKITRDGTTLDPLGRMPLDKININ